MRADVHLPVLKLQICVETKRRVKYRGNRTAQRMSESWRWNGCAMKCVCIVGEEALFCKTNVFSSQQSHQHSEPFEDHYLTMTKSSDSNVLFNACLFVR